MSPESEWMFAKKVKIQVHKPKLLTIKFNQNKHQKKKKVT